MNKKVLIIDDEEKIVDIIKSYLEKDGFYVLVAYNGLDALELFHQYNPFLVILDLMLPDINGEELCLKLRELSNCYIIILSAKSKEENVLYGLKSGADDYIRKPFSPNELLYKIKSIYRRKEDKVTKDIYLSNEIVVNLYNRSITKNGEDIVLTKNEYNIFCLFLENEDYVFTRENIIDKVFNGEYEAYDRTMDSYIKNMRKKLGKETIQTVHGVGYKLGVTKSEDKI